MSWISELTPPFIRDLVPYSSARREASQGEVWLNANENPYASSTPQGMSSLNRYPDFQPVNLLQAYAKYAGVDPEQLLVTRGIDEGIDLLTRAFCLSGEDTIIYCPPTYGMYKISAETNGVKTLAVPLLDDWQLDTPAIIDKASSAKLLYLCSPNNPTGNAMDRQDMTKVLESTKGKGLVVVDEAYIEFNMESSVVKLLNEYPHLVVLRTLSKAFGRAGLRCGFIMTNPEIISILQKVSAPYPIPVPVVDLASEALSESGINCMMLDVETLWKDRQKLNDMLKEFSFVKTIYPTVANFFLFQVENAVELMSFLSEKGVVIRNQSSQIGLENTVRVTVGTELEIVAFYKSMKQFEAQL